jgi:hypothetical protein
MVGGGGGLGGSGGGSSGGPAGGPTGAIALVVGRREAILYTVNMPTV